MEWTLLYVWQLRVIALARVLAYLNLVHLVLMHNKKLYRKDVSCHILKKCWELETPFIWIRIKIFQLIIFAALILLALVIFAQCIKNVSISVFIRTALTVEYIKQNFFCAQQIFIFKKLPKNVAITMKNISWDNFQEQWVIRQANIVHWFFRQHRTIRTYNKNTQQKG